MVKPERRPNTATLIKPAVLDPKLLGIFDMSTVSREHLLAIKNLVHSTHSTPRCSCKSMNNKTCSLQCDLTLNEAEVKMQKMCKVLNKTYRIRNNDVGKRLLHEFSDAQIMDTIGVIPKPCFTCGREDQPERFHSHPCRTKAKPRLKPKSNDPKEYELRKTVQKPVAIKFKSAKSKAREEYLGVNSGMLQKNEFTLNRHQTVPLKTVISEDGASLIASTTIIATKPTMVNDEDKENDGTNVSSAIGLKSICSKPSIISKWREAIHRSVREKCEQRENQLIAGSTKSESAISIQENIEMNLPLAETDTSAFGGYKLDSWNPAPVSGGRKRKVVCYLCAQEFGTAILPAHEAQCIRKYLKKNEHNSDPDKKDIEDDTSRPRSEAREYWKLAWELTQASLTACKFCDRKFLPNRLETHQKFCLSKTNKHRANGGNIKASNNDDLTIRKSQVFREHCAKCFDSLSIDLHRESYTNGYKNVDGPESSLRCLKELQRLPSFSIEPTGQCHMPSQSTDSKEITSYKGRAYIVEKQQKDIEYLSKMAKSLLPDEKSISSSIDIDENELNKPETDSNESQELFWKAHLAQLVKCSKCTRTFFPQRLEVHLRGCKGSSKKVVPEKDEQPLSCHL